MSRKKLSKKKSTSSHGHFPTSWVSTAVLRSLKEGFEAWNKVTMRYSSFTSFLNEAGNMRLDQLKGEGTHV